MRLLTRNHQLQVRNILGVAGGHVCHRKQGDVAQTPKHSRCGLATVLDPKTWNNRSLDTRFSHVTNMMTILSRGVSVGSVAASWCDVAKR